MPFIITPIVLVITSYTAISIGWVPKTVAMIPWATPPIISGYLVTGGHLSGAILQLFNFVIAMVIYYPFVVLCDRSVVRTEKQQHKEITTLYLCNIIIVLTDNRICENNYLYIMFKKDEIHLQEHQTIIHKIII